MYSKLVEEYKNRKYIFILGSGRNGTTFLAKELAKSDLITTTPEEKFFFWTMSERKKFLLNNVNDFILFFERGFGFIFNFRKQDFYVSENKLLKSKDYYCEFIRNNFENISKLSLKQKYKLVLDIILDIFAENNNKEYFVLHTPANLLIFELVASIIKPYKIIFMQRDIHTFFASSMKGNNRWFASDIDAIAYWNKVSNKMKKLLIKYKNNSILIYQEEMLQKPQITKERLSKFLDIDLTNICLKTKGDNTYFDKSFDRVTLLNENDIILIQYFSKNNLQYFNYQQNKNRVNIVYKIKYIFSNLKFNINYFFRRIGYYHIFQKIKRRS